MAFTTSLVGRHKLYKNGKKTKLQKVESIKAALKQTCGFQSDKELNRPAGL